MVRAYYPQKSTGSISANSNYTPQGGQVLVSQFDSMSYEDGDEMGYDVDWFNILWQKRIQLTINSGQVPSTQFDFPLLINDVYTDLIGAEEAELRFTGIDNVQLDYEIQEFSGVTGKLIAWFKKPSVSDGDIINIYFDNPAATDEQDSAAVWSDNKAVLHMTPMLMDSTGNNTVTNTDTTGASGKIGQARNFNGSTAFLDLGNFNLTGNTMTLSAWVSYDSLLSNDTIISKNSVPIEIWDLQIFVTDKAVLFVGFEQVISVPSVIVSTFALIHGVYDGINLKIYINGILQGLAPKIDIIGSSSQNVLVGALDSVSPGVFFDGIIDEVHILNISRTQDWITTEFNNQSDPGAFYLTGTIQSVPSIDSMGYEKE